MSRKYLGHFILFVIISIEESFGMHVDKRLLKLPGNIKSNLIVTIVFGLLVGSLTIGQAYYLSKIINDVFLTHSLLADVSNFLILFLVISLLKAFAVWLENFYSNRLATHVKDLIRKNLTSHLFKLGPAYVKSERSGEISNTIMNGVEKLDPYFSQFLPQLFLSALIPLAILFFVFPIDALSGIVFIFTAPLIPLFMILIGNIAEGMNKKQWRILTRMSGYFLDVIQGLSTIKLFGRQNDIKKKIELISDSFRISTMRVLRIAFLSALVLELLSTISIAIIAVEIGLRLLNGNLEFQPALFILILAPEFYLPIRQLGVRYHAGMEGTAAAQNIFKILEEPVKISSIPESKADLNLNIDTIKFKNVSFTYDGNRNAVKNISFELKPNTLTAIIGKSGSGKTTTTNLLLRFIDPTGGKIFVGNNELTKIDLKKWQSQISWISQNPYLFHETIKDNLLIAKPGATEKELVYAAKAAKIHNFIISLPDGYNTLVGERGAKLSGGQAQRIALARAFLKNTPLLILDEPTANLDPQTEFEMISTIDFLTKNKTVLVIAHRLNTIKKADQILVFSGGKIVERGNHQSLIQMNGYYFKMLSTLKGLK